jgi:hypothetical protein
MAADLEAWLLDRFYGIGALSSASHASARWHHAGFGLNGMGSLSSSLYPLPRLQSLIFPFIEVKAGETAEAGSTGSSLQPQINNIISAERQRSFFIISSVFFVRVYIRILVFTNIISSLLITFTAGVENSPSAFSLSCLACFFSSHFLSAGQLYDQTYQRIFKGAKLTGKLIKAFSASKHYLHNS